MIYVVFTIQTILEFLIIILLAGCIILIWIFIEEQRENWIRKRHIKWCEKQHEVMLQLRRKRELHRKERERYPLFYWRELCDRKQRELIEEKLEDGNL